MTNTEVVGLYDKYAQDVFRFAYSYTGSYQDAQDIVQEIFLKLLRGNIVVSAGKEKSYILKMTANKCKDLLKSKSRVNEVLTDETPLSAGGYEEPFADNELAAALLKLPDDYRTVIHLHYYEELTVKETAKILKLTSSCVSMRLTRAKQMLKEILKENGYEEYV